MPKRKPVGESQESQESLTEAFGMARLDSSSVGTTPLRICSKFIIFRANDGNVLVPQNASFVFNPDDEEQVAAVNTKIQSFVSLAKKMKVQHYVKTIEDNDVEIELTKVGGASTNFLTKKFSAREAWFFQEPVETKKKQKGGQ